MAIWMKAYCFPTGLRRTPTYGMIAPVSEWKREVLIHAGIQTMSFMREEYTNYKMCFSTVVMFFICDIMHIPRVPDTRISFTPRVVVLVLFVQICIAKSNFTTSDFLNDMAPLCCTSSTARYTPKSPVCPRRLRRFFSVSHSGPTLTHAQSF